MQNNYIIPANAKKSQLIFGFFTPVDLILFSSGCGITILMLVIVQNAKLWELILMLMPAMVTGFLVMPVLYYHNILQLITNIINFYGGRRKYYWKGWCVSDESEE